MSEKPDIGMVLATNATVVFSFGVVAEAVVIGFLFGFAPALRAARLDPVAAPAG